MTYSQVHLTVLTNCTHLNQVDNAGVHHNFISTIFTVVCLFFSSLLVFLSLEANTIICILSHLDTHRA